MAGIAVAGLAPEVELAILYNNFAEWIFPHDKVWHTNFL
jgi:hypothetical protein